MANLYSYYALHSLRNGNTLKYDSISFYRFISFCCITSWKLLLSILAN